MRKLYIFLLLLTHVLTITAQEVDSIIDIRDGQMYKVVKIGQQWWMQENLIIGIMIDSTLDATDNGIIEKYCNQNSDSLCNIYGGLYQWDEMMDYKLSDNGNPGITQGICPIGWHLPTDSEWTELTDFLGGVFLAGGKLKETGTVHWHSPNTGATNESGFTALPGGMRTLGGTFSNVGRYSYFWSSTVIPEFGNVWDRDLKYDASYVFKVELYGKTFGFSVRCLMDSIQFDYLSISDINFKPVKKIDLTDGLTIDTIIIINSNAGEVINIDTIQTNTPVFNLNKSSAVLSPGDSIHLNVVFNPPVKGVHYSDTLHIISDDPYHPITSIPLSGYLKPDSIIDVRDGQVYKILKIGQQWWMQENLNIGIRIDGILEAADNGTIEKYCYDDQESKCAIYGGLYQWDEMMDYNPSDNGNPGIIQGICPAGWHLPTDSEWTELTDFLGGESVAGGKLKEAGTTHWTSPNTGATNESGFIALPGGNRLFDGNFYGMGNNTYFWSSTEFSSGNAQGLGLYYSGSYVVYGNHNMENGISVRCLRDSCQFGYLTISDKNLNSVSTLNFYGDDVREKLIIINTNAGKTIHVSSIYTKNTAFSLNKTSSDLSPGDSIHLIITFDPPGKDIYPDTLFVKSDDSYDSLITIPLNGTFPPEILFTDSTNISCFGYADGAATVTPSFGTPPYQYQWDDPGNTTDSTITGLEANIYYHVTVTDSLGWTVKDSIMLFQPSLLTAQITDSVNISCFGYSDGTAVVTPSGGTSSYNFDWDDPEGTTDSTIMNLLANQYYHVTITDANGCTVQDSVILSQPALLLSSVTDSSNISCHGYSDGSSTVTVNGGTPPYVYLWDDQEATTDSVVTGLSANECYHVSIQDAHGCSVTDSVMLSQPDPLAIYITDSTNISCYDGSDGTARVAVFGGTMPYIYSWDNPEQSTDAVANGLSAGVYYHTTVTDAHSCPPMKDSVILSQPSLLVTAMTDSANISCNGFTDGTATVTPSGGTPPYYYQWNNPGNNTDSTATGLSANHIYHVNVTDDHGCYTIDSIILSEPDPLEINPTYSDTICFNSSDGFISTNPSGGTPPYDYIWSNSLNSQTITGLEAGEYSVRVTDSHGCIDSASFFIQSAVPYDGEKICIVTVDLLTGRNLIVWEKTPDKGVDYFNIYREDVLIGTVGYDNLSIFIDTVADPEKRPYLYTLRIVDTCGNESTQSPYHKPLFLQYVSSIDGVNLMWSKYEIEGEIINFDSYNIYRGSDSIALSPFEENIPTEVNVFTDNDPNALARKYFYRVAGILIDPCLPTGSEDKKADSGPYSHSMSNMEDNRLQETPEGIGYFSESGFKITPNPFNETTTILFNNQEKYPYVLSIMDLTGKVVKTIDNITDEMIELNQDGLPAGLYLIELRGPKIFRSKIVIE